MRERSREKSVTRVTPVCKRAAVLCFNFNLTRHHRPSQPPPALSSSDIKMSMFKIPDWLLTHPELRKRGIVVHKPLQPVNISARTYSSLLIVDLGVVYGISNGMAPRGAYIRREGHQTLQT